jgi:hypothetical protein
MIRTVDESSIFSSVLSRRLDCSAAYGLAPEIQTKLNPESWMRCCQSNENGNIAALRARFIAVASIR